MQLFSRNKAIVALSLGALALGACGDDVTVPIAPNAPITLSITPPSASMNIGEAVNFAVQISGGPSTGGPTLASCTSSSATVITAAVSGSSCRVTAVAAGNATVTATASTGQSAAASVSVAAPAAAISGLMVSPSAASVQVNQTVTIVPNVNRGAGVTVAYTYASSTASVASVTAAGVVTAVAPGVATITVTATGTGAGFTTTQLTSAAAITVTALPTGLTALNVTPSSLTLATGSTAQIGATSTQPSGASAATYTYASGSSAVASVSSTGLVSAVAPGTTVITVTATSAANANFAAATLSSAVAVTVSPVAQIAISYINLNSGVAVDINNVNGNILVGVNIATNGNVVTSAQLFACSVGAVCPAAGQTPVAQQTFGAGGASSGAIQFAVNTAAFTVSSDFSSSTTNFPNGQTVVVATLTSAGQTANSANSNLAVLNLTNPDGFAVRHVAPANSAVDASGNVWFGGPGATGRGTITVVPVIYTPGRTFTSVSSQIAGAANCVFGASTFTGTGTMTFTSASTKPWTYTYGASLGSGLNASNVVCTANTTTTPTLVPIISASTDNANVSGVSAILTSTSTTQPITAPATIRADFARPDATSATYTFVSTSATANLGNSVVPNATFVNNSYNFVTPRFNQTTTAATEPGVGLKTPKLEVKGCGSATWTTLATNTGADVAECATDLSAVAYTIRYTPEDLLGNAVVWSADTCTSFCTLPASGNLIAFGVDKSPPQLRWSASTDANGTTYASVAVAGTVADTAFSAEAIDDRAGLQGAFFAVANAKNVSGGARSGLCVAGAVPFNSVIGSTFISNPNCTASAVASFAGSALVDGYRMVVTTAHTRADLNTLGGQGYYTEQVRITDRAGNLVASDKRYVLVNTTVGTISVTAPAAFLNATSGLTVAGSTAASVETATHGLQVQYGALGAFTFPAVATGRVAFDDVSLASSDAFSLSLPFTSGTTFYTNLEQTNGSNAVGGITDVPSGVAVYGTNFAGFGAFSSTQNFSGSLITSDATAWGTTTKSTAAITTLAVVDSTAAFNSPAGGLKVRLTTTAAQTASPFTRIDYYIQSASGVYSYLGSVDATSPACTSGTCSVYVSDNGLTKSWTYVLRSAGSDIAGSTQRYRGTAEVAALNGATPTPSPLFVASQIVAVAVGTNTSGFGVVSVAGRGLMTQLVTLP